ncbi:MAG: OmpA family protein [Candidatus Omnitrophica bacterium]|nr:OmpA family protein [Candidatus Omnitrophota bacterium]
MKKLNFVGLLLCVAAVSILAGCATPILKSSHKAKQYKGADTSWYGKSGAQSTPIMDVATAKDTSNPTATAVKRGSWWMPKKAPKGKNNTVWGNRGYVYLAGAGKAVEKMVLQDVYFSLNSSELTLSAKKIISANAKALKENPRVRVALMGYASPEGLENSNVKLSENRALAVKDYLVKSGVSKSSVLFKGEGEMEVNESAYPSARKVHFKIISQ